MELNTKIEKLKAEREKNEQKITRLRGRNAEIDRQVTELENLDIVGLVRDVGMTPEQLAELIRSTSGNSSVPAEEESGNE